MNQIILPESIKEEIAEELTSKKAVSPKPSFLQVYTVQFYLASILLLSLLIFFLVIRFQNRQKENYSQVLLGQYQVSTIYANTTSSASTPLIVENTISTSPFVIGIIQIDSIKLNYPILSESSPELLEISPCRFAGPMPNEVGNLCIAGHNYADNRFFGRLDELQKGDLVKIFDLRGQVETYFVNSIARISSTDTRCTNQETGGEKILTLLTCNNLSTTRLAVQCTQK